DGGGDRSEMDRAGGGSFDQEVVLGSVLPPGYGAGPGGGEGDVVRADRRGAADGELWADRSGDFAGAVHSSRAGGGGGSVLPSVSEAQPGGAGGHQEAGGEDPAAGSAGGSAGAVWVLRASAPGRGV